MASAKSGNWLWGLIALAGAIILYELWRRGTLQKWLHLGTSASATNPARSQAAPESRTNRSPAAPHAAPSAKPALETLNTGTGLGTHYIVQRGDTLSSIAARAGVPLPDLERANPQISNPNLIMPGESITIPTQHASTATASELLGEAHKTAQPVAVRHPATTHENVVFLRRGVRLTHAQRKSRQAVKREAPHIAAGKLRRVEEW